MTNRELWWDIYKWQSDDNDFPGGVPVTVGIEAADFLFAEITKRFPDIPSAEIELLIAKSRSKLMRKLREKVIYLKACGPPNANVALNDIFAFADLYDPTGKETSSDVS